jgi:methionyl-tRNA synthetase
MRDMVLGQDSNFSEESLIARINADLANDLGNCLNRVERMVQNYFDSTIPRPGTPGEAEERLITIGRGAAEAVPALIAQLKLHASIEETLQMVRATNRYLEERAPWRAIKTDGKDAVGSTLWTAAEAIRLAACLLSPVMPAKCGELLFRLGVLDDARGLIDSPLAQEHLSWGLLGAGTKIRPSGPLFPRIEPT